jgi:hypothetical protein
MNEDLKVQDVQDGAEITSPPDAPVLLPLLVFARDSITDSQRFARSLIEIRNLTR